MSQTPDPTPFITETWIKQPLLKGWKYPVGAEIVTRGLEACLRRNELKLNFWNDKAKRMEVGKPKVVQYAEYFISRGAMGNWDRPPQWSILVQAVPSEIAHRVRELHFRCALRTLTAMVSRIFLITWILLPCLPAASLLPTSMGMVLLTSLTILILWVNLQLGAEDSVQRDLCRECRGIFLRKGF